MITIKMVFDDGFILEVAKNGGLASQLTYKLTIPYLMTPEVAVVEWQVLPSDHARLAELLNLLT